VHWVRIEDKHNSGNSRRVTPRPTNPPQIAKKSRQLAEARCAGAGERLTPGRLAAYAELMNCDRPTSAYELIALLEKRQEQKIAPLTVYRHLDFLIRVGLVHRLESTQSYLPCVHPEHNHESQYLLCSVCGRVDEVESKALETMLSRLADQRGFQTQSAIVEIKGLCGDCSSGEST
jgi:Fur family zinc uptake transcriptional regulator